MITKEHNTGKTCLFCASDYHLEMILLPYISERINNSKIIIFTENNLEESLQVLLTKVNINEEIKEKIKKINWKNEDKKKELEKSLVENKKIELIINGNEEYIRMANNSVKYLINDNVNIIDCFHVADLNVDISEISKNYNKILNTQKIS